MKIISWLFVLSCLLPGLVVAQQSLGIESLHEAAFAGNVEEVRRLLEEGAAVDVLHGQEVVTVDLVEVVDTADIRVGDLASGADFVEEPLESLLVSGEGLGQEFQGNRLA